jgi:hypothetical protein
MKIIAALIERVFKNYITTVLGILLGFAGAVYGVYYLIPSTIAWQGHPIANTLVEIAGIAIALAGAIAKDKDIGINPPTLPTKVGMIALMILAGSMLWPARAQAQTSASTGLTFSAESEAFGIHYLGNWQTGASTSEILKVAAWGKTNQHALYALGNEFNAPGLFNGYGGGFRVQPDISGFLTKRTLIPSNALKAYFEGVVGNALSSTSNASNLYQRYGGGVQINLNQSGNLVAKAFSVHYDRIGAVNAFDASAGLSFIWGK